MVSHASLVEEIATIGRMSAEDRLIHARQRRQEQIQRWHDAEYEFVKDENKNFSNGDVPKRVVKFGDSVTLLEAAARDDIEEVQFLLKNKTDPNEANDDGLTALHQACIDNFEDMVQLLIDHGANVNAIDSEQWTPLHAACTCGHTEIAKILVKNGAELMALNADHNMPYDICEDDTMLDFVEKAMAFKGITQDQINTTRSSRERQIIQDMESLLKDDKSLDFQDEVGATVMHVAAANGYSELTRFLLLHNSKVNIQDCDGWTPLHAAACWCQIEIVELLGAENADPTVKNNLGETPADVTDDEEIKALLAKIKSAMKTKTKNRILNRFPAFSGRNTSRRSSGIREQSFRVRSKRDKKAGISKAEAKSEAQFWTGHQDTSDANLSSEPTTDNNNHIVSKTIPDEHSLNDSSFDPKSSEVKGEEQVDGKNLDKGDSCQNNSVNGFSGGESSPKDLPQKEKKKGKKNKRAPPPPKTTGGSKKSEPVETNGKSGGSLRHVIGFKKRYSLVDAEIGKENGSGKTLAELKRMRSHETEEKTLQSPLGGAPTENVYSYPDENCDDIKQFKGHTSSELSSSYSRKQKFCVIL